MTDTLLLSDVTAEGPFPKQSRRLRAGIVGGGRIAAIQAMGARLTDRWEIVAGALSSRPDQAKARAADWYLAPDRAYADYRQMAEAEAGRADRIDAVIVTTPNDSHHAIARTFLAAGIDVICDKPITNTLDDARDLVTAVEESGLVFGVCHAFACYPMIRQARAMVRNGAIGRINQIHVEYLQDWMTDPAITAMPHVKWRLDPSKAGATAVTADIGTHAQHMVSFVSGLEMTRLRADMHVLGSPQALEDTVIMGTRFGDVPGTLIATRVAPGNYAGFRWRMYGDKGGLEWDHEHADFVRYTPFGEPTRMLSKGFGSGIGPAGERFVRLARGNAEGWIEAWANFYAELAVAVAARRDGRAVPPGLLQFAGVEDGARGVRFVEAAVESHRQDGAWVDCRLAL